MTLRTLTRGGYQSNGHQTSCCPCLYKIWSNKTCLTESLFELSIGPKQSKSKTYPKNFRFLMSNVLLFSVYGAPHLPQPPRRRWPNHVVAKPHHHQALVCLRREFSRDAAYNSMSSPAQADRRPRRLRTPSAAASPHSL